MWAAASGNHSIAPHCFLTVQERWTEPGANGPGHRDNNLHAGTSPANGVHQHVLQLSLLATLAVAIKFNCFPLADSISCIHTHSWCLASLKPLVSELHSSWVLSITLSIVLLSALACLSAPPAPTSHREPSGVFSVVCDWCVLCRMGPTSFVGIFITRHPDQCSRN